MPTITISSDKFPGISFNCPQIPNLPEQKGSHYFAVGTPYEVTEETLAAIQSQLASSPESVTNELRINVSGNGSTPATTAAVTAPPPPPAPSKEDEGETPPVEEVTSLTDEDLDLIEVEISKLIGKGLPESQAQLVATGGNEELPKAVRVAYLDKVVAHPQIKKALKEVATNLKEQIQAA